MGIAPSRELIKPKECVTVVILHCVPNISDSKFQIPNSKFQIPSSSSSSKFKFQVPRSTFHVPSSRFEFKIPDSRFNWIKLIKRISGVCHLESGILNLELSIRDLLGTET